MQRDQTAEAGIYSQSLGRQQFPPDVAIGRRLLFTDCDNPSIRISKLLNYALFSFVKEFCFGYRRSACESSGVATPDAGECGENLEEGRGRPRHTNDAQITELEWGRRSLDVLALPPDDDL